MMKTNILRVMTMIIITRLTFGQQDACTTCRCLPDDVYGGTLVNCSYLHLQMIPGSIPENTTSLLLNKNNIIKTPGKMFSKLKYLHILDLSSNRLIFISEDSFDGLGNLKELDLSSNKLTLNESIYSQNLFYSLKQIMSLKINNNSDSNYLPLSTAYPDKSFQRLESLQVLYLDGLPADFGPGFRSLIHLTNLSLSDSDGFCVLPVLRNSTFRNVPHLKHLNVSNCMIVDTEHDTFSTLSDIITLDVSLNPDLGFDNFSKSTFGLRNSHLSLLIMNRLYPLYGSCSRLKIKHIIHLQHTPLKELHFEGNGIIELEQHVLTTLPKSLETLYAGKNGLGYGIYILELFQMKSLRNLYITQINGWHAFHRFAETRYSGGYGHSVRLPNQIETLDVSWSYFDGSIYSLSSENSSLKTFIGKHNLFASVNGSFALYPNLEYIDLSHNAITYFNRGFSVSFPSVKYVNVSYNSLGNYFDNDEDVENLLQGLFELEYFDISSNGIDSLPENAFNDMSNLKTLVMSDNKIRSFNHNLSHMKRLQYLDLSFTTIGYLGKNVRMDLDNLQNVTVNLANNVLSCTCNDLEFLQWMQTYRSNIKGLESSHCKFSDQTLVVSSDLDNIVGTLSLKCVSYTVHFITSLSLFVMTMLIITSTLIHRFRWRLRYMYYVGSRTKLQTDAEIQYVFDGFVSYADKDRGFVKEEIIQKLEKQSGLKLCIHDRDFIPGSVIASNITNAIQNSRKTLIILSEDFLKSDWCDYEFNMARTEGVSRRQNVIVVVMYRRVPRQNMTHDMASFLAKYSYIEFDTHGDTELFWSNLIDAIKTDEPHD